MKWNYYEAYEEIGNNFLSLLLKQFPSKAVPMNKIASPWERDKENEVESSLIFFHLSIFFRLIGLDSLIDSS